MQEDGSLLSDKSTIIPLKIAFLNVKTYQYPDYTVFYILEKISKIPQFFESSNALKQWFLQETEGDGLLILLPNNQDKLPSFYRTSHASIPLFVSIELDKLILSWDFEAVTDLRSKLVISRQRARLFIMNGPRMDRNTIIEDVFLLFPGDSGYWRSDINKFIIKNEVDFTPFEEAILSPNAQVIDAFTESIQNSLEKSLAISEKPVLELSAGYDSSCLAISIAPIISKNLFAYTLVHDGVSGQQQNNRLKEIVEKLCIADNKIIPSSICSPFLSMVDESIFSVYNCGIYDEIYWYGIWTALEALSSIKPDLILTGVGGDEITHIYSDNNTPEAKESSLKALFLMKYLKMK